MNEQQLENALKQLWIRENALEQILVDEATAEHAYKVGKATAFLAGAGSEKAKEANAVIQTEELFLKWLRAKASAAFAKEKLRDVQAAISARQTLVSSANRADRTHSYSGVG